MDIRGLKIADLREVPILKDLTDEERSTIKYAHVYGNNREIGKDLSALYVTTNDKVFLAGFDSMVGEDNIYWSRGLLNESREVEELSGKSVRRIVVGEEFGAALTDGDDLYLWGSDLGREVILNEKQFKRLAVKPHEPRDVCHCGRSLKENSGLSRCNHCRAYIATWNTLEDPPLIRERSTLFALGFLGEPSSELVLPSLYCLICQGFQTSELIEIKSARIIPLNVSLFSNSYETTNVLRCTSCHTLIDHISVLPLRYTTSVTQKTRFTSPLSIIDITAGRNFLLIQTSTELIIWGELRGRKYNRILENRKFVDVVKVACGSDHIAAITTQGDLFTWGDAVQQEEASKGGAILGKVPLEAPAVDVSCGLTSTVCLLKNGECFIRGKVTRMVSALIFFNNSFLSAYRCIPAVLSQNYAKVLTYSQVQHDQSMDKQLAELTGDPTDEFVHLHDTTVSPAGKPIDEELCVREDSELQKKNAEDKNPSGFHDLFGQQHLSDLTLKLADGDMPVHRCVLHSSSSYFKKLFSESISPAGHYNIQSLDMSSYNALAYRGLLQYLYKIPIIEMECEDMIDLYVLATSYKEDWVAADVFSKLKSSISPDNVLRLLDKAKATKSTELELECHKFINAPEFKKSLLEFASENMDLLTEILRVFCKSRS
ncbi:hypothetical protein GE061_002876 [Apolygus lucorum]|uniref:BTB domain-containing protein n=1 Tax=Apolygus lucorum TaxID=248454 RepID=A0A6A4J213_APOLU|nr:hypothetical protein GE061_002876 [Apolygus lucorum]